MGVLFLPSKTRSSVSAVLVVVTERMDLVAPMGDVPEDKVPPLMLEGRNFPNLQLMVRQELSSVVLLARERPWK